MSNAQPQSGLFADHKLPQKARVQIGRALLAEQKANPEKFAWGKAADVRKLSEEERLQACQDEAACEAREDRREQWNSENAVDPDCEVPE